MKRTSISADSEKKFFNLNSIFVRLNSNFVDGLMMVNSALDLLYSWG